MCPIVPFAAWLVNPEVTSNTDGGVATTIEYLVLSLSDGFHNLLAWAGSHVRQVAAAIRLVVEDQPQAGLRRRSTALWAMQDVGQHGAQANQTDDSGGHSRGA